MNLKKESSPSKKDREIFENLFVLEAANNHLGSLPRGLKIIRDFGTVVRFNNVRAAIKLQFRDVGNFVHVDFQGKESIRYIAKMEATKLSPDEFAILVAEIKNVGCIPMATPFDEKSVDLIQTFGFPIIKVASSDVNDWPLLEKIATTKKPVIVSSGGASEKNLDDVVLFFENREIPLAINHCVSLYPSEDFELQLNQISYLRSRYPSHVIGFSSHEHHSWDTSMHISYALGARTWERHVDVDFEGVPISSYCSSPEQVDLWFKAFQKTVEMFGGSSDTRRVLPKAEIQYLDALVRGVHARRELPQGYVLTRKKFEEDFYLAVPLRKGQLSSREVMNGEVLRKQIAKDAPLTIDDVDGPYSENLTLKKLILDRGYG